MNTIEHAARELVAARARRFAAKKALLAYRKEHGSCERSEVTPCHIWGHYPSRDAWCEVCQGSEPLYEAQKKAAADVGAAMRRLTRACNRQAG